MSISWWLRIIITRWCYHEGTILEAVQVLLSWMIQKLQAANPPANCRWKLWTSKMHFLNVQKGPLRRLCLNAAKLIDFQCPEIIPLVQFLAFSRCVKCLSIKRLGCLFLEKETFQACFHLNLPRSPFQSVSHFISVAAAAINAYFQWQHKGFYITGACHIFFIFFNDN